MKKRAIQPKSLNRPAGPYSQVIVSGDIIVTAGQIPLGADGQVAAQSIEDQARQVFENVALCLEAAGCTFADVIKVNAFLSDLADFDLYNKVYVEYFQPPYPVRTTVQAGLAPPLLLEVEVWARKANTPVVPVTLPATD
jgi:reactive intermediate/imine deaminase